MGLSKKAEKEFAKILYVNERITAKEVAERVHVTETTIGKWIKQEGWDKLRKSLLTTRQAQLVHWYNQLDCLNEDIASREKPIPTHSEADTMSKITANIQRLEVETNLGEYVEVGKKVLTFIQDISIEDAKLFKNYIDLFINSKIK